MNYDKYYGENKSVFGEEPDRILVKYRSLIQKDYSVLDIGCGQGRNTIYLSKLGFNVEAIDPSNSAIQIVEGTKKEENLTFNCLRTDFKNFSSERKYSAILLFGLLQILDREEIELLKARLSKWLMKEGLIFLTSFTVNDNSHEKIKRESMEIGKYSYQKPNGEKRTFFESSEIKNLFSEYQNIHYWEGVGPEHHHGDDLLEKHELVEAVIKF